MKSALDIAREARALLACEVNWIKGMSYADMQGNGANLSNACRFCLSGAIDKVEPINHNEPNPYDEYYKVRQLLNTYAFSRFGFADFVDFNDAEQTTHAQVLDALDWTIGQLGAKQ